MIAIGISLFGALGLYFLAAIVGAFINSRIIGVIMAACAVLIIIGLFFGLAISLRHDLLIMGIQ